MAPGFRGHLSWDREPGTSLLFVTFLHFAPYVKSQPAHDRVAAIDFRPTRSRLRDRQALAAGLPSGARGLARFSMLHSWSMPCTPTAECSSSTWPISLSTRAVTIFFDGSGRRSELWGGTLLQWLVPFLLAAYFFTQRQTTGFVFCLFFFFENWLYTATYMADARAQVLPLVTTGDPEFAEHDFFRIFSDLGVLNYDTKIAAVVRLLGWCGMICRGGLVLSATQWQGDSSQKKTQRLDARFIDYLRK